VLDGHGSLVNNTKSLGGFVVRSVGVKRLTNLKERDSGLDRKGKDLRIENHAGGSDWRPCGEREEREKEVIYRFSSRLRLQCLLLG